MLTDRRRLCYELLSNLAVCCGTAMKMQNVIRAERSGVVKSVAAAVGDTLQAEDIIIEFED